MITAIIIDDEEDARGTLSAFLKKYCPAIKLLGEADGVEEGLKLLNQKSPQLIFLDVQMRDGSGFDFLDKAGSLNARIIFITAYDQFALKALKYSATDYLLKPIDPDELIAAVEKITSKPAMEIDQEREKYKFLVSNVKNGTGFKYISIPDSKGIEFVKHEEIIRCQADGNYTAVFLVNGRKIVASKILKDFEEYLSEFTFYRVHHSHLINLTHVKRYTKADGGYVVMSDNSSVEIAVRKKAEFLQLLHDL